MQTTYSKEYFVKILAKGIVLLFAMCTWIPLSWFTFLTTSSLNPGDSLAQTNFSTFQQILDNFFGTAPGMFLLFFVNLGICLYAMYKHTQNKFHRMQALCEHVIVNICFMFILIVYIIFGGMLITYIPISLYPALRNVIWPFNWIFIAPLLTLWVFFWIVQLSGIKTTMKRLYR